MFQIAVSVFSKFLVENDMQIILVVFDKNSFQLSGQIVGEIDSYIDANYVRYSYSREYPRRVGKVKEVSKQLHANPKASLLLKKSMNDEITSYRRMNTEYQDYIETWIHEIKISCTDICGK